MRRGLKKYTKSKVMYLATLEKPLNVSVREPIGTDLGVAVELLVKQGMMKMVGSDDCDRYYRLTVKGWKQHISNRIEERKRLGKSTDFLLERLKLIESMG